MTTRKGFTLVELMIVVTIMGVLSLLAIVGYRKFTYHARNSEAHQMLGAVRAAQEVYFQAYGQYCGSADVDEWPVEVPFEKKINWDGPNIPDDNAWSMLGLKSPGQVWFQYRLSAGLDNAPGDQFKAEFQDRPWFWAQAVGDFDGDNAKFSTFEVTSAKSEVWVSGENN